MEAGEKQQPWPGAEEEALLKLSGVIPRQGAEEALRAVNDSGRFVALAVEHGVAAFVLKNIVDSGFTGLVSPTAFQSLRNQSLRVLARNSFVMAALGKAILKLNSAGMVPVLLKGTALEHTVYRYGGLRPMADADILLTVAECLKAWQLLQLNGFVPLPFKSPLHKLIPLHVGKHLPSLISGGFSLEIHHSLFWGKGREVEEKITGGSEEREVPALEGGVKVRVRIPPPGLHFLYLVSHISKHELDGVSQLRLYNDLAAMLEHYGIEEVLDKAREFAGDTGLSRLLAGKLGILKRYMGVSIPESYNAELTQEEEERFLSFLSSPDQSSKAERDLFYRETIRAIPGLHRKVIFLLGDIIPGFAFMKRRYGKRSVLAVLPYYLLRPGKLWWMVK